MLRDTWCVCFEFVKGSGRAFSAGGDIVNLYHLINQGKRSEFHTCVLKILL